MKRSNRWTWCGKIVEILLMRKRRQKKEKCNMKRDELVQQLLKDKMRMLVNIELDTLLHG